MSLDRIQSKTIRPFSLVPTLLDDMNSLLCGEVAAEFQDVELLLNENPIKAHKVKKQSLTSLPFQLLTSLPFRY